VVTSTVALSNSSLSIAAGVPKNAKTVTLNTNQLTATGATAYALTIAGGTLSGTNGIGQVTLNVATSSTNQAEGVAVIPLPTAQTIWVTWTVTGGSSPQLNLYATGYTL